jgi:2-keto-3-deoxy-6-phosphogluconate aldolase
MKAMKHWFRYCFQYLLVVHALTGASRLNDGSLIGGNLYCVLHNVLPSNVPHLIDQMVPFSSFSISLRHNEAIDSLNLILSDNLTFRSQKMIGASTVNNLQQAEQLEAMKIDYMSTMFHNEEIISFCHKHEIDLLSGIQTMDDCYKAIAAKVINYKLYPINKFSKETIINMIHTIQSSPFNQKAQVVASGGVQINDIPYYQSLGINNFAVGIDYGKPLFEVEAQILQTKRILNLLNRPHVLQ